MFHLASIVRDQLLRSFAQPVSFNRSIKKNSNRMKMNDFVMILSFTLSGCDVCNYLFQLLFRFIEANYAYLEYILFRCFSFSSKRTTIT